MAAAAAAAAADRASVPAIPVPGAHSHGGPPAGEGEGAAGDERDAGTRGVEAVGDSEEDGEDVFEVERILDMKTEGVRERAGRGSVVRRARAGWFGGRGPGGSSGAEGESREVVRVGSPEASGGGV